MSWLERKAPPGHKCDPPSGVWHSKVRLTLADTKWQCPVCNVQWGFYSYSNPRFREHQLGPNDYWYTGELRMGY